MEKAKTIDHRDREMDGQTYTGKSRESNRWAVRHRPTDRKVGR